LTDPLLWLIYLLTYSDTKLALPGSRRRFGVNDLVYTWVSATMEKFIFLKGYEANKCIREILKKVWGLSERTFEKAARNRHDGKTKRQHWKRTEYISFFSIL